MGDRNPSDLAPQQSRSNALAELLAHPSANFMYFTAMTFAGIGGAAVSFATGDVIKLIGESIANKGRVDPTDLIICSGLVGTGVTSFALAGITKSMAATERGGEMRREEVARMIARHIEQQTHPASEEQVPYTPPEVWIEEV